MSYSTTLIALSTDMPPAGKYSMIDLYDKQSSVPASGRPCTESKLWRPQDEQTPVFQSRLRTVAFHHPLLLLGLCFVVLVPRHLKYCDTLTSADIE